MCGFSQGDQDNWLFTQHISKAVPEGSNCPANGRVTVFVNLTYTFRNCRERRDCNPRLKLYNYFTNSRQDMTCNDTKSLFTGSGIMHTNIFGPLASGRTATEQRTFSMDASQDGFYLALQDFSMDTSYHLYGACVSISRLIVYRHECHSKKVGLVYYPDTPAPSTGTCPTVAQCAENAHPTSSLGLTCDFAGHWGDENPQCECDAGYVEKKGKCIGK